MRSRKNLQGAQVVEGVKDTLKTRTSARDMPRGVAATHATGVLAAVCASCGFSNRDHDH